MELPLISATACIVLIVLFLITAIFLLWPSRPLLSGLPPGPRPLPLWGNLMSLFANRKRLPSHLSDLSARYGSSVVRLFFGSRLVVVLNDKDVIREAFHNQGAVFSGKADLPSTQIFSGGRKGIATSTDQTWNAQRNFTLALLRNIDAEGSNVEEVTESTEAFLDYLYQSDERPVNPEQEIMKVVSDVIGRLAFGPLYDSRHPEAIRFLRCIRQSLDAAKDIYSADFLPMLRYVPGYAMKVRRVDDNLEFMMAYIQQKFVDHRDTFDKPNVRDLVDAFLMKKEQEGDNEAFTESNIAQILIDFYLIGVDTISSTLRWAFLYMALHPEIQAKIREELPPCQDDVMWSDRKLYPYTQAAILEVMRIAPVCPLAAPHCTTESTALRGYSIPEGCTVLANVWAVQNDPKRWQNPREFKVERFLNDDGGVKDAAENMMPFCSGLRQCTGELPAKMQLFLFFTSVLQHFQIQFADKQPTTEVPFAFTMAPEQHELVFKSVLEL